MVIDGNADGGFPGGFEADGEGCAIGIPGFETAVGEGVAAR